MNGWETFHTSQGSDAHIPSTTCFGSTTTTSSYNSYRYLYAATSSMGRTDATTTIMSMIAVSVSANSPDRNT